MSSVGVGVGVCVCVCVGGVFGIDELYDVGSLQDQDANNFIEIVG
jgi:hypothetical protein